MAFEITNIYEELVIERVLDKLKGQAGYGHDLMEDIVCLALNKLPAKYVRFAVDAAASLDLAEHDNQDIAVDTAIEYAIEIVRKRRHDKH